jgi:MFS family permease
VTDQAQRRGGLRRAFSHRNFVIYTAGNFPSQIGVWAQRVAIGWLTWQLTESPFFLGLMAFADLIPVVLLNPFAGYFTDHFNRLRLAKILQFLNLAVTSALAVCAYGDLLNIELLLLFALLTGMDHALFQPVRSSLNSVLVPREDLAAAVAFGGISWNSARFVGPAVAGLILKVADANLVFLINAVLYLWFFLVLWALRLPVQPKRAPSDIGVLGEIVAGYGYALRHPVIGPLFFLLGCASFLTRPVVELLPGFAAAEFGFGQDAGGLAWLVSAMGVGAMASGLWIAQRGRMEGLARITTHTLLGSLVALLLFAYTTRFEIAVVCMAAIGFMYSLFATCIQVMVQSIAAEHMRGRVLALYGMLWIGSAAFGALIIGALSEVFGLRLPIAGAGAMCLLVWLWAIRAEKRVNTELLKHGIG